MKVIHIKDAPKNYQMDQQYVFIGRPSKWGNPYHMKRDGSNRDEVCDKYRDYLLDRPDLLLALHELKDGKTLICYCKTTPEVRCHGDEIVRVMQERGLLE